MALTLPLNDYIAELILTKKVRLLVEGNDDRVALEKLLARSYEHNGQSPKQDITIDTADRIQDSALPLNSQRIAEVLKRVSGKPYEQKLVAFSDREYNGFSWHPEFNDSYSCHKVTNRLV